ncbi:thioredoxin family protein [Paenibacillus sp. CAU 1782]
MPLSEWNEKQVIELSRQHIGAAAILFTTPLCGTCKVAERMLEVVEAAGIRHPVVKMNINFAPNLAFEWKIQSVPCLVLVKNGTLLWKEYAMQSAGYLYERLKG